jgi:hypothetical protein
VVLRVVDEKEKATFLRKELKGPHGTFRLGPFATKPKKMVFNEFLSIMSQDKVEKK